MISVSVHDVSVLLCDHSLVTLMWIKMDIKGYYIYPIRWSLWPQPPSRVLTILLLVFTVCTRWHKYILSHISCFLSTWLLACMCLSVREDRFICRIPCMWWYLCVCTPLNVCAVWYDCLLLESTWPSKEHHSRLFQWRNNGHLNIITRSTLWAIDILLLKSDWKTTIFCGLNNNANPCFPLVSQ